MPRPHKLSTQLVAALKSILKEKEDAAMLLTEEDVLFLINQRLPPKWRISLRTWARYKSNDLDAQNDSDLQEALDTFQELLKAVRIDQKYNVLSNLLHNQGNAASLKWLAERKFQEWNSKHKPDAQQQSPVYINVMPYSQSAEALPSPTIQIGSTAY